MPEGVAADGVSLERGVVHVYWFSTDLSPSEICALDSLLSPAERERADRFRFERDRRRFIAGRGRLRVLLERYTGQAAARGTFATGTYGKPALRPAHAAAGLQFNLSRTEGLGVVALGAGEELGIDVERLRPFHDALAIAERLFTGGEYRALCALPAEARLASFFSLWTRKEAVVKSLGRGLTHPLDAFELAPAPAAATAERVDLTCDGVPIHRWVLPLPPLREGCVAALATAGSPPVVRGWTWPGE